MKFQQSLISLFVIATLSACGSSSSSSDATSGAETITATFIDSAVAGLNYQCGDLSGTTNTAGEFILVEGEICSFSINGFNIGETDKISATNLIVTPYDTADDAEAAAKIAAILQTIDADGDVSNGLDLVDFDKQIPSGILDSVDELTFIEELASAIEIEAADVISLTDAKAHLDENVIEKKGYHSTAVQEVIDDIIAIYPTIETVNYQEKLAEYQAILEAGDDSNNSDIEVLQSVIAITEVINNAQILTHLDILMLNSPFDYTDMLPQLISLATQAQTSYIIDFNQQVTGTSEDVAALLYDYSLALITLSDKLEQSFSDENYIAMYSKDETLQISYQHAQFARMTALSAANQLSLLAAYDVGADDFFISESAQLEDIPVFKVDHSTAPISIEATTINIETENRSIEYDPQSYLQDANTLTLRQDEKYLATAKDALTQLSTVAKTIDLTLINPEIIAAGIGSEIDKLYTHMHADDGETSPLTVTYDNANITVNLQAFYNLATGLDKDNFDLDIDNMFICAESNYNIDLSKVAGQPMCDYSGTGSDIEGLPYLYDSEGYSYYLQAIATNNNAESAQLSSGSNIEDVLLSCEDEETKVDCMPL